MTCVECKRAIEPGENYIEGEAFEGGHGALHDECSERYADRYLERQRLAKLVVRLIDETNGGSPEALADAIVEALTRSHRTLQQGFLSAVKLAVVKYGQLDAATHVDLRNEQAHNWAREIAEADRTGVGFARF